MNRESRIGEYRDEAGRRVGVFAGERWHLNGMRANCAHFADQTYHPGEACAETGYQSGSAWLFEPVPPEVLAELRRLFGKPDGWALEVNRFRR